LYWFDAGECCSNTGYLKQLDFFSIKAIFISHPHYDHMGGLLNLFSVYRKIHYIEDDRIEREFDLFLPMAGFDPPAGTGDRKSPQRKFVERIHLRRGR